MKYLKDVYVNEVAWKNIWDYNFISLRYEHGRTQRRRDTRCDYSNGDLYIVTRKGERLIRLYR